MAEIYIGVAGWSYPDWAGVVYPRPRPRGFDPLSYLAKMIDLIEINSTFYHPGSKKNADSWVARTHELPNFKFTAKLWRKFTHERASFTKSEIKKARAVPEVLESAGLLGAVLAQFPWSFRNTQENRERLSKVVESFSDFPVAVEVRHGSWDLEEVREMLKNIGAALVNLDQPIIGDSIKPGNEVTAGSAYVRLHGRNHDDWFKEDAGRDDRYNYLYTGQELAPWKQRIEKMATECDAVYVVANNHFKGQALVNALQLKHMLGQPTMVPAVLHRSYPLLSELEEP